MSELAPQVHTDGAGKDHSVNETPLWAKGRIVFQGQRVPRNKDEVNNPALIEQRVAAENFAELTAGFDVEEGSDSLPGIDEELRRVMGIVALPDNIIAAIDDDKR